jgi:hypothetical protein
LYVGLTKYTLASALKERYELYEDLARDIAQTVFKSRMSLRKNTKRGFIVGQWLDIVFYEVPGNQNGKMSQRVYIDSVLYPHVLPAMETEPRIVLEEDGDSGHGLSKNNIVRQWKERHGLKSYFNPPKSPDLSIIENCWQPVKQFVNSRPYWHEDEVNNAIIEG